MVLVSYKPKNIIVLVGLIVMIMHFLQAGRKRATLPGTEESMITIDFITALFCQVDDSLSGSSKHPEAHLWPSEVVTLGLLHALKGVGNRAFYRWLTRDYRALFPRLPERTRLFRLFTTHQGWTHVFLAAPTVLGVSDTYGIELIHPMREGRSPQQIGCKGLSNHRWIGGGTLCLLLNQWGLIVAWACATANVADNTFQWLIRQFEERMIVLSDTAFHATEGGSQQPETVSARGVAGPPAGGDGAVDVDLSLPLQKGHAPGLDVLPGTPGVHYGRLQYAGPVAWLTAQCMWFRFSLNSL